MVLVLIQSSKLFKYYPGVGCLHSTLSIWDLGPLTLSGDRGQPDGEYPWPHSPRAPSCRCCLVGASTGSGVLIGPNVTVSITQPRIWPYILWSYRVDSYNMADIFLPGLERPGYVRRGTEWQSEHMAPYLVHLPVQ